MVINLMWLVSQIKCEICTNIWVGVYPYLCNEEILECPSCGAMNSEIIERWGPNNKETLISEDNDIHYYE